MADEVTATDLKDVIDAATFLQNHGRMFRSVMVLAESIAAVDVLIASLDDMAKRKATLTDELDALQGQIADAGAAVAQARSDVSEADAQASDIISAARTAERDIIAGAQAKGAEERDKLIAEATETVLAKNREAEAESARLAELSAAVETEKARLADLQAQAAEAETKVAEAKAYLAKLAGG